MGKPKKGKKGRQDDEFGEDEVEVDPIALAAEQEASEASQASKPAAKKGKKGRRKKDDEWDDDVADEIAKLSLDVKPDEEAVPNGQEAQANTKKKGKKKNRKVSFDDDESGSENEEIEKVASPKPPKKNKGKPTMSAFQMLAMEDDEDNSEEEVQSEDEAPLKAPPKKQGSVEEEDEDDMPQQQQQAKGKQKGKKGKQKGKKAEEEDIDALLAAIDQPEEKKGKKKKKKGGLDEETAELLEAAPQPEESKGIDLADISNMTQEQIAAMLDAEDEDEDDKKKKKKKKKGAAEATAAVEEEGEKEKEKEEENAEEGEEEGATMKTAAQKKKEKKERQRLQKLQEKEKGKKKGAGAESQASEEATTPSTEAAPPPGAEQEDGGSGNEEESDKKKKKKDKKKKKKGEEEEEKEKKKKPVNKQVKAMQEALKAMKEEEERLKREAEEEERRAEEAIKAKAEKERLEKEKKELNKIKKKEKMEKLKAEGKYMTAKQKEAQRRAQQMLESMKAQGIELPQVNDADKPKKRVVYDNKKKKKGPAKDGIQSPVTPGTPSEEKEMIIEEAKPEQKKEVAESWEDVKDDWEASSDEEVEPEKMETEETPAAKEQPAEKTEVKLEPEVNEDEDEEEEEEDEDSEEESSEEESSSEEDSSSEEEEKLTPAEKLERIKEKCRDRLEKAHKDAEAKRTLDNLRAPVVVVLGHVDTGKTKILDKLRRTNVQDGEAGGITQQIGATNVPEHTIKEQTKMCKEFSKKELKIPGLLIIDTPGHESFSNLRNRGSSLCDIAILVIDIMHALEPQTIESINLLKKRKTPFVVALNKVDRLFGWQSNPHADVQNTIKKQKPNTKIEFDERVQQTIVQLAEQGLNACLFYENKNPREYISLIPTSAHSGDGMGNLIALICELTQTMLAKRLMWSEELQAITMEVKAIPGLGTTIDVILVNGMLKEGQTVVLGGTEGAIVTQIRGLLMPQPLKELRVKGAYQHCKEVLAAQGVKIIAKDLEKGLAGLPMYVAHNQEEIEVYKEDVEQALGDILDSIKVQATGVFVQASTLGSLEALLEFLRTSKIPYAGINIGPVHRKDIMKASVMLEHDDQYAVILAFDVKVEREAQEMAESLGVRIFTADIIYHLFDQFMAHRADLKKRKQEEFKHIAVFPCKLRIMPQYIFNSRDPIVMGVIIEGGFVKEGTPLCVPSKEFLEIGRITSIEVNHKTVDMAKKGQEVCLKIEPIPGDAPKMFGRHFDEKDIITSKISRQSIDAVKDYFREEMGKGDWQLMVELKKLFQIL